MGWTRDVMMMIRRGVKAALADVHTHIPAQVISYDAATNTCSIQPCIKVMRTGDAENLTTTTLPVIEDIPVKQFGSGKCLLTVAPQAGSYGEYHVSERALENWLIQGGIVDPSSARKFDLSDGVFHPGLYPLAADGDNGLIAPSINTDRIELRTRVGTTYIAVLADGSIDMATLTGKTVTINGNFTVDP